MVSISSNPAQEAKQTGYRVESPRASDAVGSALRDAFAREMGLPEDMTALLRQLNGFDRQKSC